jgi:hypothetical protein
MFYEATAAGLFATAATTVLALAELRHGILAFKGRLSAVAQLDDVDTLFVPNGLFAHITQEATAGREAQLATAADQSIVARFAYRFPHFGSTNSTENDINLIGPDEADRLLRLFPDGFIYDDDSFDDRTDWQSAKDAPLVSSSQSRMSAVVLVGVPIEQSFKDKLSRGCRSQCRTFRAGLPTR